MSMKDIFLAEFKQQRIPADVSQVILCEMREYAREWMRR